MASSEQEAMNTVAVVPIKDWPLAFDATFKWLANYDSPGSPFSLNWDLSQDLASSL
jgi:hypothetical protein